MNKQFTGALKSPKDLRDYRIAKSSTQIELPQEFTLNHSHIKNQGLVNSCVAHSLSSILETQDNINYSTGWIYGYRLTDYYQGEGMIPSEALKTIFKVGYLPNIELDVNVEMAEAKSIVDRNIDNYISKATKDISSYARLYTETEIKQALYLYKTPVIACIDIDEQGLKLDNNYIAYVPNRPSGGHAVVCYGWNEIGFLIQNSWGEKWGNKGTFILPYQYPIYEAWVIKFNAKQETTKDDNTTVDTNDNTYVEDTTLEITKPNYYWLREFIMIIIKFIRNLIKK